MCVQNNESAAMFVYKKNPVGIELFSHVKTFFYSEQFDDHVTENYLKAAAATLIPSRVLLLLSPLLSAHQVLDTLSE